MSSMSHTCIAIMYGTLLTDGPYDLFSIDDVSGVHRLYNGSMDHMVGVFGILLDQFSEYTSSSALASSLQLKPTSAQIQRYQALRAEVQQTKLPLIDLSNPQVYFIFYTRLD